MTRYAILLLLAAALGEVTVRGQLTVNYDAAPGQRNVVDSSGNPVPDGNIAAIGFFTSGFDVAGNASDYTALQSAWHLFGAATITHLPTSSGTGGRFAGVSTQNDSSFNNQKIYLWVTETNLAGVVDEYGLYSSTSGTWAFPPNNNPQPNTLTITSSQVDTFLFGTSVAGTPGSLELAVVPEPSSIALLTTGLVLGGFFLRRR